MVFVGYFPRAIFFKTVARSNNTTHAMKYFVLVIRQVGWSFHLP